MTKQQEQEVSNVVKSIKRRRTDLMPWGMILATYEQASKELGHTPALAAVYELGAKQKGQL